jgi:hypothetical protein
VLFRKAAGVVTDSGRDSAARIALRPSAEADSEDGCTQAVRMLTE